MELKGLENAWMTPTGRLVVDHKDFFHENAWHEQLALHILADMWGMSHYLDAFEKIHEGTYSGSATETLEDKKWVRLHGFQGCTPVWIIPSGHRLTKKQEETILDWCVANSRDFNNCLDIIP